MASVDEMKAADKRALEYVDLETLVERAGTAVAVAALRILGGAYGRRVVVVAGKGSNGADGRIAARLLSRRGARVEVLDAQDAPKRIGDADLVIDAAYGTGFRGSYNAPAVPAGVPVLAVDIPSGVDGDTGEACGEPLRADLTVTMAAMKPGLLQGEGMLLSGRVEVADIGLQVRDARTFVVEDDDVARLLPQRPRQAHKWDSAVGVVAGSPGMTGAAELCARGAYRGGAGMVRLAVPGAELSFLELHETVAVPVDVRSWSQQALSMLERCKAVVVGPGLGRSDGTVEEVRKTVKGARIPVVLDADGLFAMGTGPAIKDALPSDPSSVVMTPHEGEFARLNGAPLGADHIAASRALSTTTGAVVLLKGPVTVVSDPAGVLLVATAGPPRLATAGTGDVLAGVIAAFVARGLAPHIAAALAAHVHGRAAAMAPREGFLAGELPDLVARFLSNVGGSGAVLG